MPPKRQEHDVEHWLALYQSGMTYEEIGRESGVSTMLIWNRLRAHRGHGRTTAAGNRLAFDKRHASVSHAIVSAFNAGASVLKLSQDFDLTRSTILRLLGRAGIEPRSGSDANRLRFTDPVQRGIATRAAHLSMGKNEAELAQLLLERGLKIERQRIVGPYNLDLAFRDVAVEVHVPRGYPLASRARDLERCKALLRLGWHVLYVWTLQEPPTGAAADEVVSFMEETGRHPAASRQYRVISGDGEFVASGTDPDEVALEPPAHPSKKRSSSN